MIKVFVNSKFGWIERKKGKGKTKKKNKNNEKMDQWKSKSVFSLCLCMRLWVLQEKSFEKGKWFGQKADHNNIT